MMARHPLLRLVALAAASSALHASWFRRRGSKYPLRQIAQRIGVGAPWTAPKFVWAFAWRSHRRLLPLLHRWDAAAPENTCVNLQVLWLKAIAGDRAAYELLPRGTRTAVRWPFRLLYPRLHHQNVLLRSAYLDDAVLGELAGLDPADCAVVALGAGFCTRAARLFGDTAHRTAELDLPAVVAQKRALAARYETHAPADAYVPADLAADGVAAALDDAVRGRSHVVFILEALLIYLEDDAARRLLRAARATNATSVSLCFADRLPMTGVDEADARAVLADAGFELGDYLPKPGLARHMGVARRVG